VVYIPVILIIHDPEGLAALAETVVVYENDRVSKIMLPIKKIISSRDSPRYHLWPPPVLMNPYFKPYSYQSKPMGLPVLRGISLPLKDAVTVS
jgi:hypothetical protein